LHASLHDDVFKPLNTKPNSENPGTGGYRIKAVQWMLAVTLIVAPLFRAGQPPVALLILELLALAILVVLLWTPQVKPLTRPETLALLLLFAFPLPYLFPLPAGLFESLPGREQYAQTLSILGDGLEDGWMRLSLLPRQTESAWLLLLLPTAVFLGTRALERETAFKLFLLVLGVAALQSIFGLMQFGNGPNSPLYLGMDRTHFGSAVGTYTNRNHLAGLLEMVLPVTLALLISSIGRGRQGFARNWRGRISFFASVRGHRALVFGALALLLLVGVVFTRSRSGIALSMLGILLTSILLSRRIGGTNVYGPTGTLVSIALGIGVVIGLAPVLDRFTETEVLSDARFPIFAATFEGIGAFFPVGSGPGTYPGVFPAFQPLELGGHFINHAHNDYLEWLFEGGVLAALLILLLLLLYVRQWTRVWTKSAWTAFRFVQVGAGIGIFLMLLHTLVDYNLHIPANIVYFSFFAAVFFSDPSQQTSPEQRRKRRRRTPRLTEEQGSPSAVPGSDPSSDPSSDPGPREIPADQVKNPFLD
jgi:O-antigen ligase